MLVRRLRRYLGLQLCRIVSRPLSEDASAVGRLSTHISCRLMGERELLPYCTDPELELSERHVRSALARGDLCVAAFDGACLVGYEWFAFGPTPHIDGVWVEFDARARYSYKKFVRPGYRGQRIGPGLSSHGDRWCMQRGCSRTVAFIDLDNEAAWRASSRLGSRTVGYAGYVSLFGLFLAFRTAGARDCGFRFYYAPRRSAVTAAARNLSHSGDILQVDFSGRIGGSGSSDEDVGMNSP